MKQRRGHRAQRQQRAQLRPSPALPADVAVGPGAGPLRCSADEKVNLAAADRPALAEQVAKWRSMMTTRVAASPSPAVVPAATVTPRRRSRERRAGLRSRAFALTLRGASSPGRCLGGPFGGGLRTCTTLDLRPRRPTRGGWRLLSASSASGFSVEPDAGGPRAVAEALRRGVDRRSIEPINPLAFMARRSRRSACVAVLADLGHGERQSRLFDRAIESAAPYLYYAALGLLAHLALRALGARRRWTSTLAVALWAGAAMPTVALLGAETFVALAHVFGAERHPRDRGGRRAPALGERRGDEPPVPRLRLVPRLVRAGTARASSRTGMGHRAGARRAGGAHHAVGPVRCISPCDPSVTISGRHSG